MSEKSTPGRKLTRRELMAAGVAGSCAFGLAGLLGCTPQQDAAQAPGQEVMQKGFMRPVPSRWFSRLDGGKIQCELCPRVCRLAEGQRAPCRVRENREGVMYTLAHGNPALVQEDPVERKPFYHVVPGSRALSISTAGCNLECKFCEVWDMALVAPEEVHAYDMPPEAVVSQAQSAGLRAISYAFGEPVIFYEYMADVAALAKQVGLLNLIHTAGYLQPEPLGEISELLDAANVDLKSFDPDFYRQAVGGEIEPVLRTLTLLRESEIHIEITNVIIPTLNDSMQKIEEMCRWIVNELGADVPVHFARFYPLYKLSSLPRTPVATLDKARETAMNAGLDFVYVAKVTGHQGENTFCPGCGEAVIKRVGFVIRELHVKDGSCSYCGMEIPGRWA